LRWYCTDESHQDKNPLTGIINTGTLWYGSNFQMITPFMVNIKDYDVSSYEHIELAVTFKMSPSFWETFKENSFVVNFNSSVSTHMIETQVDHQKYNQEEKKWWQWFTWQEPYVQGTAAAATEVREKYATRYRIFQGWGAITDKAFPQDYGDFGWGSYNLCSLPFYEGVTDPINSGETYSSDPQDFCGVSSWVSLNPKWGTQEGENDFIEIERDKEYVMIFHTDRDITNPTEKPQYWAIAEASNVGKYNVPLVYYKHVLGSKSNSISALSKTVENCGIVPEASLCSGEWPGDDTPADYCIDKVDTEGSVE